MSKVKQIAAAAIVAPVFFASTAFAATAGQIEGGDIYRVRNVTTNGEFTDPANADLCQVVQFKVRIHNPGPDALTGVNVKATLDQTVVGTSHSSKVTVTAENANPKETSDTAGVNTAKATKLTYVAGSTELLDANNAKLSTLGDGILTSGVEVTNGVGVSTQQKRFVQFQAKTDCPTPPPVTPPTTPTTPATPTKPATPAAPTTLVNAGAGDVVAIAAGAVVAGAVASRLFISRRLGRN